MDLTTEPLLFAAATVSETSAVLLVPVSKFYIGNELTRKARHRQAAST